MRVRSPRRRPIHGRDESPIRPALDPLAELSPDPIFCFDPEWAVTFANPAARRMAGLVTGDMLAAATYWTIFPDAHGQPVEEMLLHTMAAGRPGNAEFHRFTTGTWLDVNAAPSGNGIAVFFRDITLRKRAVFDAIPLNVLGIDRNWTITFINRTMQTVARTPNLVGANLWERYPGSLQEPFVSNYRRAMHDRVEVEFEAFYGEPLNLWCRISLRPYEDGILILSEDITSLKLAEMRRDAATAQLTQVLEATTDAVVSFDPNGKLNYLNQHARTIIGIENLQGHAAHPFQSFFDHTMRQRIPTDFETFYPPPVDRWFAVQCRPTAAGGVVLFFHDITQERRSRERLLEQQATLSFIQQTARIATWVLDTVTGTLAIAPGSYPVFGQPNERICLATDLYALIFPEDLARMKHRHARSTLQANMRVPFSYRIRAADGSTQWLEGRSVTTFDEAGNPTGARGMTMEITARKQEEKKLIASEARYRVLADLNPQAMWMADARGNVIYANQGFVEYTGIPIPSDRWIEGIDPRDHALLLAAWAHSVQSGTEYHLVVRILRGRDGASRWWTLRALPVRDAAGNILNWLGLAQDIHDTKTAAEALRLKHEETERQRAEIETVYRTAPIALALFDPVHFRYLRVNDRHAEIVGLPREQILGRTLTEIAPIPGLHDLFQQVLTGNPVHNHLLEGSLPSLPGEHRFWSVNYFPVCAPDGSIQAIAAASQDITQQKLSERALIESEKLAAVGRLASSISHEINNPLEAVTNLLYIIAGDPHLTPATADFVKVAQAELARVSQIATQTLRFHRQAVHRTLASAADLVDSVLQLYHGRLANSSIQVDVRYATAAPILCFENDIRQVFNNLIANAIDAMRTGGRLLVRAHRATSGQPGIRITVADTGSGMSAETKARIFEPFFTTKDLNGTGLGLWISAGIVANHHGTLTVRSSMHPLRHGTVFTLFLPLTPNAPDASDSSCPKQVPCRAK